MKIAAIIQARTRSERFPGKVSLPLPFGSDKPLIGWPIEVLQGIASINQIIIATSVSENDSLKTIAKKYDIGFFEGDEDDVLGRFVDICIRDKWEIALRITGDNPILDASCIQQMIDIHVGSGCDYSYSSNLPVGMNIEIMSAAALIEIYEQHQLTASDKEHVTLFFRNNNDRYKVLKHSFNDYGVSPDIRVTVDYPADYAALNVIAGIAKQTGEKGMGLIKYIDDHYKWVWDINKELYQKKVYASLEQELPNALSILKKSEMFFSEAYLKNAVSGHETQED